MEHDNIVLDEITSVVNGIVQTQNDNSQINISDVIEVIQTTDPSSTSMFVNNSDKINAATNINQNMDTNSTSNNNQSLRRSAYIKITEQPASKALRFRYECEGRSAGSIPGISSTPELKTFPTIQICEYRGRAVVVVSCVTKDPPYRPHPHNLVGKDGCKKGVCTVEINSETMAVSFSNLGIQCVKKKDIEEALRLREEIRVDPFRTGFGHRAQPSSIDLNAVRLCFQVFLQGDQRGFTVPLTPQISDPIYDKKAMSDLVICKLSDCSASVAGGKEIILLCEKVAKEDISVRFFEEIDGQLVWEGIGDFQHTNVHKQVAISFRAPRYKTLEINQPVKCFIQLKRPSDGATSESLPFDFIPLDSDTVELKRKRQKFGGEASNHLLKNMHTHQEHNFRHDSSIPTTSNMFNIPLDPSIKTEPIDTSPSQYNLFGGTAISTKYRLQQSSPSPQPIVTGGNTLPSLSPHPFDTPNQNLNIDFIPTYSNYQNQMNNLTLTFNGQNQIPWNMLQTNETNNLNRDLSTGTETNNQQQENMQESISHNIPSNLSSLLDLDNHQMNSSELLSGLSLSLLDGHFLSATDVKLEQANKIEESMTDSFTRLTTATINEITDLNNIMYNRKQ